MKKSRTGNPKSGSRHEEYQKRRNRDDNSEEYVPRRRKDAGKRFHRQKPLKETLWENESDQ